MRRPSPRATAPPLSALDALIGLFRLFAVGPARTRGRTALARPVSRIAIVWLAAVLIGTFPKPATAVIRITDDRGGNIGEYWSRYMALRSAGQSVVIDGTCSSACTIVLGILPYDHICMTRNAVLGFHAAWRPGFLGIKVINEPATRTLLSFYPGSVRQWINHQGGLGTDMIFLSGPPLLAMYRQCR